MPYQEAPREDQIADQVAIELREAGYVRCTKCGNRLFYVEEVHDGVVLIGYCWKCKRQTRFFLGMPIELT